MQPGRSAVLQPHIWLHQVMGEQVSAVVVGGALTLLQPRLVLLENNPQWERM